MTHLFIRQTSKWISLWMVTHFWRICDQFMWSVGHSIYIGGISDNLQPFHLSSCPCVNHIPLQLGRVVNWCPYHNDQRSSSSHGYITRTCNKWWPRQDP